MDGSDVRTWGMIGKLLRGHYQVICFLGGGGGGETYIAVDIDRPGQPQCVVKRLKPINNELKFLPLAKKLFKREAETLEQLGRHDQIPRLLAYFEEEGEFYLVQDFIEGQPLSVELPPGRCWSEMKVIRLLEDVLKTLEFVHAQGAIHRDVKPANLIRRHEDGKIVLIDFGAVKQISQNPQTQTHINPTTISIGTQGYMSSEQVRGRPRPSSDIYSLGMIGIQALTGIGPVRLDTDRNGEVSWQHHVQVSNELAAVLTKMVREHFCDRYESATEVLQALKHLIDQKLDGESSDSVILQNTTEGQEQPLEYYSRFELQETKVIAEQVIAEHNGQPSCTWVIPSDSILELQKTAVVPDDEPDSDACTSESTLEPRETKIVADSDDQNQPFPVNTSFGLNAESQQTKIDETPGADLQGNRETDGFKQRLGNFRNFSTRNSLLALAAGSFAVVALTGLIWILNSVKQPVPVMTSLQSPSESSPSQTPESLPDTASESWSAKRSAQEIYAQLQQYLQQKNWEAADRETYEVMLKIAGPKSTQTGELDLDEWQINFGCGDLQEIDSLWRKASNGRLGFSAQLEIFRETFKQVTGKNWNADSSQDETAIRNSTSAYFDRIGWRPDGKQWQVQWEKPNGATRYQYTPGKEPDFENPPVGHLPAILSWSDGQDHRLQKSRACNL